MCPGSKFSWLEPQFPTEKAKCQNTSTQNYDIVVVQSPSDLGNSHFSKISTAFSCSLPPSSKKMKGKNPQKKKEKKKNSPKERKSKILLLLFEHTMNESSATQIPWDSAAHLGSGPPRAFCRRSEDLLHEDLRGEWWARSWPPAYRRSLVPARRAPLLQCGAQMKHGLQSDDPSTLQNLGVWVAI